MGKSVQLSSRECGKCDAYFQLGLSNREIARRLRRSEKCIRTYRKNPSNYGKNYHGKRPALTTRDKRRLLRVAGQSTKSCFQLRGQLNLSASRWSIARCLNSNNLSWRKMLKKPNLSIRHKEDRLNFCRQKMQETWNNVWFSDEKRFTLDGPDCCSYYWHDVNKETIINPTRQNRGGGLMVWGGVSSRGKTKMCITNNKLNSKGYQDILNDFLLPELQPNDEFVQDNASIHNSFSTTEWLKEKKIKKCSWPSKSPDLNIMENVWGYMVRNIYQENKHYNSVKELKEAVEKEWEALPMELIQNLLTSMPTRIFECIRRNGSYTKY